MEFQEGFCVQNKNGNAGSIRLVDKSNNTSTIDVPINEAKPADGIPKGAIVMFKGHIYNLPANWKFCDGNNGTPNLRNRFILGATFTTDNKTGGWNNSYMVKHGHPSTSTNETGNHLHSINFGNHTTTKSSNHTHSAYKAKGDNMRVQSHQHAPVKYNWGGGDKHTLNKTGSHTHTLPVPAFSSSTKSSHTHTMSISTTTGEKQGGNLPPYYSLAYIMKVK